MMLPLTHEADQQDLVGDIRFGMAPL